jgi:hypothetical protein
MSEIPLHERLRHIDLGNGVAEHDNLLFECTVETQHFSDLLFDRVDLVLGTKGAGKSSLFRIFGENLVQHLYKKHRTIAISGVETMGEPIFKTYGTEFEQFSEKDFESFWKAYLLGLVYNKVFNDPQIKSVFAKYPEELADFGKLYTDLGLLDIGTLRSPTKLLKLVCAFTIAAVEGVNAAWDVEKNQLVFGLNLREKVAKGYQEITVPDLSKMDTVLCIDALARLTEKSGYKIWILLDHLDVVFRRRSQEEARALRALLKVLYSFTANHIRLKVFLRDDILEAISADSDEPLAALSHITARAAPNLKWTSDSLCIMIMKRMAANSWLAERHGIDAERVADVDYARAKFQELFAFKYVTQQAFDWIFSLLSDGRGVVTPRDLIDLLKKALHIHSVWLERHPDKSTFMSIASIQEAHREISKNRRETVLQTEFSHVMHWIKRLERNKEKYDRDELPELFGEDSDTAISTLQAIGVIAFDQKKACYRVAKLYGPGLQVYATRARRMRPGT